MKPLHLQISGYFTHLHFACETKQHLVGVVEEIRPLYSLRKVLKSRVNPFSTLLSA
jgi:hypothetical protein